MKFNPLIWKLHYMYDANILTFTEFLIHFIKKKRVIQSKNGGFNIY